MNGLEREILKNNIDILTDGTRNVDNLLRNLTKRNVFNRFMSEDIRNVTDVRERRRLLYENLATRGPAAYEHLIGALYETDNDKIADKLLMERYSNNTYLKVNVIPAIDRCDSGEDQNGRRPYKMGSNPKGYALIVNIHDFFDDNDHYKSMDDTSRPEDETESTRRFGSYRDVSHMYTLLTQLGYDVTIRYNLTLERFNDEIDEFRKRDHSKVDSCFVVIMSHGESVGGRFLVKTYDGQYINYLDVIEKFYSVNCSNLHGKPKIFIFQMCRGVKDDMGIKVILGSDSNVIALNKNESETISKQMSRSVNDVSWMSLLTINGSGSLTHESGCKDCLVIFPSAPGTTSKRDRIDGSWLLTCICTVLMKHSWNTDIYNMLQRVEADVEEVYDPVIGMQTTWVNHGSFRTFYFNPGLYNENTEQSISNGIES